MTRQEAIDLRNQLATDVAEKRTVFLNAKAEYKEVGDKYEAVERLIEAIESRRDLITELEALLT